MKSLLAHWRCRRQLLAQLDADAGRTLASIAATKPGRARLERLADAIRGHCTAAASDSSPSRKRARIDEGPGLDALASVAAAAPVSTNPLRSGAAEVLPARTPVAEGGSPSTRVEPTPSQPQLCSLLATSPGLADMGGSAGNLGAGLGGSQEGGCQSSGCSGINGGGFVCPPQAATVAPVEHINRSAPAHQDIVAAVQSRPCRATAKAVAAARQAAASLLELRRIRPRAAATPPPPALSGVDLTELGLIGGDGHYKGKSADSAALFRGVRCGAGEGAAVQAALRHRREQLPLEGIARSCGGWPITAEVRVHVGAWEIRGVGLFLGGSGGKGGVDSERAETSAKTDGSSTHPNHGTPSTEKQRRPGEPRSCKRFSSGGTALS